MKRAVSIRCVREAKVVKAIIRIDSLESCNVDRKVKPGNTSSG